MEKRFLSFFTLLPLFLILLFAAPAQAQAPQDFELLTNTFNWCSDNGEFKSAELPSPAPSSCATNPLTYGRWFKFQASTSNVEISLLTGGKNGTLQFPYLGLYDANGQEIVCKANGDVHDPLKIIYTQLSEGESYFILVNNHNHSKYVGTFSLCVTDVLSYDFAEGAVQIPHNGEWCSEPGAYTTVGASPDKEKAACLKDGPNFNRWFKFTATTGKAIIKVEQSGGEGNFEFPYISLWT